MMPAINYEEMTVPRDRTLSSGFVSQRKVTRPVEKGRCTASPREALTAAAQLLPYQRQWIEDDSPLKVVVKGRQTGYSFSATLRAVFRCLHARTTWIFLSKGERQSQLLMEKVREHIHALGMVARFVESGFFEGTLTKQLEVRLSNGSVIYGLPANPETARGYSGNVTLDEFAFHADAEKIYSALYPIITRGYGLEVISTPNGQQGKFFEIARDAGLTDPALAEGGREFPKRPDGTGSSTWSGHWCDIYRAAREGLKVNLELLRAGVDEDTWRREYCCEFLSSASEWISAELFQSCVSSDASVALDSSLVTRHSSLADGLYAGWDIARNRDLSVIWLSELLGDVTWTRGVIEMRNLPTPDQVREARSLMPLVRRMNIDQSGMGLAIFEQLEREFPGKVEGVQFTQQTKEAMAVLAKRRMEETKVRLPEDIGIRASFGSVKRTQNALGQFRFDTEHDSRFGHADHWWAFCLAESAARQPGYHLASAGALIGRPATAGLRETIL